MKTTKRILSILLAGAMTVSLMVGMAATAFADMAVYNVTVNSCTNGTVAADVTSPVENETVTLTVTPDSGYGLTELKVMNGSDAVATTAVNATTYTFTMPAAAVTVSATFNLYLDREDGNSDGSLTDEDSYADRKTVDQNYNLRVRGGTYTDVTKVKLEWTTTDIAATRTDNKTWNPDTLSWDAVTSDNTVDVSQNGGATFTLTNLSSVKVNATATFAQEGTFSAPTVTYTEDSVPGDGVVTLDTVVGTNAARTVDTTADHDAVIGVTVEPVAADFKALAATSSATKYGTYTVTLSAAPHKVTYSTASCVTNNGSATAADGVAYTVTLTSSNTNRVFSTVSGTGVLIPYVKVGGSSLTAGTDYTVTLSGDKLTATITINADKVTGDIVIGTELYM